MLRQKEVICFDKKKRPINKFRKIDMVGINNAMIVDKMIYESVYSTISRSRSRIQST